MKKDKRSRERKQSVRAMALLITLLMILSLILPVGATATEESANGSGTAEAVSEENHSAHEEEESSSVSDAGEKEEKDDSSDATEESGATEKEAEAEKQETETSEKAHSDDSADKSDDSASGVSDSDGEKEGSADHSQKDSSSGSRTADSADVGAEAVEEKTSDGSASSTQTGKDARTEAGTGASAGAEAASSAEDSSVAKTGKGTSDENDTALASDVKAEVDDGTLTFRTDYVTVVADKAAFDTDVTMVVRKVTDPVQLLRMVTALNGEGGSYTVKAYNVSFYDKNGKEVEPGIPVQVNVNTKVSTPSRSKVVHVKDDDRTEILDADIDKSGASFEIGSFSDIGVAIEGKTKIPGSSFDVYLGDKRSEEYTVEDLPAGPISEEDLPVVEGYVYKNATAGNATVEEIGTITDVEGNVYVYYTTKDDNGTLIAEILGEGRIRINLIETEQDTSYDLDADGMHVHIEAPSGAFEAGTYMEISAAELTGAQQTQVKAQAAEKLGEEAELNIQAVDITFYDREGQKIQPQIPVEVELTTPKTVEGNFCVVHLGDDNTADRVEASRSDEGAICFTAESFSVYAVVGDDTVLGESRMTLNFYNGETLIATVYVKNDDDTDEELEQIIYDPGAGTLNTGELFKGWIENANYGVEDADSKMDIADIRAWAKEKANADSIEEGEEHNFYAMIFNTFSVTFKDEDGATIHSEALIFKSSEGSVDYTINQPYTPKEQDEAFQGWYWQKTNPDSEVSDPIVAKDGSEAPFMNDTEVTIKDNITFTVNVPRGNWLIFVENGESASYTPPQFIQTGEKPQEPNDPKRFGYVFGGWYTNPECDGDPFDFDQELTERTRLYAKWTANPTANYTVIVWVENVDGDGYDFATMQTLNGAVGSSTSACLTTAPSGDATFATIQGTSSEGNPVNETYNHSWTNSSGLTTFKGFTFKEYEANNDDKINADGTSVLNVYYDRIEYTLKFYYARSSASGGTTYSYNPISEQDAIASSQPIYGSVNGSYLELTYNGSNWEYEATETVTHTGTRYLQTNNNTGTQYAWTANGMVQLTRTGGNWYLNGNRYTGTRYLQTNNNTGTQYAWTADGMRQLTRSGNSWTYSRTVQHTYNGTLYIREAVAAQNYQVPQVRTADGTANTFDGTGGNWAGSGNTQPGSSYGGSGSETRGNYTYYYRTLTAKYGTYIGDNWPTYNGTDFATWNNYRAGSWAVMRDSLAYQRDRQGTVKGKITTMDEEILGDLTSTSGNFVVANYDTASSQYDWTYSIYFENESGSGYSLHEDVFALSHDSGNNWATQQHPPAYPGMVEVRRERVGNTRHVNYYYDRRAYPIVFMDGHYVDGNGVGIQDRSANSLEQTDPILYGASVASYNAGESNYYEPAAGDADAYDGFDPTGFVFGGWYVDAACTIPYTFDKMPLDGITVYAKWVQKEYRVFLHPNVPTEDLTFDMGGQNTSFRVADGEKIAGGNTINAIRDDYDLIGWYTDEACTKSFNFDAYVLNESTVTTDYAKTEDTERDKYGNPTESGNKDASENRFWIDKKLDLYAKWRARLDGADGIHVIYDPGEGTNAPSDLLEYLDNSGATAGAASTPNDTKKQFMHWVVQTWNGTAYVDTDEIVYPGDIFTVLKDNSKILVTEWVDPDDETDVVIVENPDPGTTAPDNTHTKIKTASYTVQLRAEYGDKEAPTPTHIWWFPNDVGVGVVHDAYRVNDGLQINEAVVIPDPPERSGYKFLGWARVEAGDSESSRAGESSTPTAKGLELTENNLFLKYEDGGYKAEIDGEWTAVTKVAADEQDPYHDMYAVWEKTDVDITVNKVVTGNMGDVSKDFTFTAVLNDGSAFKDQDADSKVTLSNDKKTATFSLKGGESIAITALPSSVSMTITEINADSYTTTANGITGGSLSGKAYTFTVPDEDGEVTFTNEKTAIVDTGVSLDFLPYVLILGAVAAGAVLIFRRRKEV